MANHHSRHHRRSEPFSPVLSNKPSGPRQGESKVAHVRQGPHSALRSKNMRILLELAKDPEDLAVLAELPLERLRNLSNGALFSDETSYHLEQQLNLSSGWFDQPHSQVPARLREALAGLPAPQPEALVESPALSSASSAIALPSDVPTEALSQAPMPSPPAVAEQPVAPDPSLSSTSQQPSSDTMTTPDTNPNELRRQNLMVLLSGKGAKSAMARLLGLSPASVTGMLNGTKPLDDELMQTVSRSLTLGEDWFDQPRKPEDIPEGARGLLVPLMRGALPPPPVDKRQESNPLPELHVGSSKESNLPAVNTGAPSDQPKSWPAAPGPKVARVMAANQASSGKGTVILPEDGADAQKGANAPAGRPSAEQSGVDGASAGTSAGNDSNASATGAPVADTTASGSTPTTSTASTTPAEVSASPTTAGTPVAESVAGTAQLNPIAEALVKMLTQKALSGALSEDAAFDMLGQVRKL